VQPTTNRNSKKRTGSTHKAAETVKNENYSTEGKNIQSNDDEEDCNFCKETITVNTDSIRCDVSPLVSSAVQWTFQGSVYRVGYYY